MHRYGPGRGWSPCDALGLGSRDRVRRRLGQLGGWPLADPCFDSGGGGGSSSDPELTEELKASDPNKYWQLYWKKETGAAAAFATRDETKKRLARLEELEKTAMTPEQRKEYADLKKAQASAEDERKRKEGEFDQWRAEILQKHEADLAARDERLKALESDIAHGEIRRAFLAETDYFGGGENSKTVLVGDLAVDALGRFVRFEDYDFGGDIGKKKTIIVRDHTGKMITDKMGRPAPFKEALDGLLESHPGKDHILRGSGKTGSGATGTGVLGDKDRVDLSRSTITREQARDPRVRKQLEAVGGGGIQMGRAFNRPAKADAK